MIAKKIHFFKAIQNLSNLNLEHYSKRKQIFLFFCLCFFFLTLSLSSLLLPLKKSLTYDENYHYQSGLAILSGQPSKRGETKIHERNVMPISALNPLFSKIIGETIPDSILSESIKTSNAIFLGRLATIFSALILLIYVFCWARQLYGVNAGFLALSLCLLDPNIIAQSRLVTQDIFGTCSVFIATYYFWNFLKFRDRKNFVLSAISFGIAQISRYTAIYLLPIYFVLAISFYSSNILNLIRTKRLSLLMSGIKSFLTSSLVFFLSTVLIVNIGFSFDRTFTPLGDYQFASQTLNSLQSSSQLLRMLPIPLPISYLRGLDMGKYKQETGFGNGYTYLMGQLGIENNEVKGFKEYFFIAFLYKVPIATQLILLLAIINLIKYRSRINFWQNEFFLIFPALFFFTVFSVSVVQIGIRYILMIFPFLFVFSSQIAVAWKILNGRSRLLIIILVSYLSISNLSYFPHYLSYFNEFLFDRKMGYTILADSNLDWGQNRYYLKQYLEKNSDAIYMKDRQGQTKFFNSQQEINFQQLQVNFVIVEANQLLGITADPKHFQWLRENYKPVDSIAYSYLVFKIQPQDLQDNGVSIFSDSSRPK
ncbi:MAG: ArnT family glycosyltransferase [Spirulina sp.]